MRKFKIKKVVLSVIIFFLVSVAVLATIYTGINWDYAMSVFGKSDLSIDDIAVSGVAATGDELVGEMAEDSIVLLKNENGALPLSEAERKINLFGYGSTDNGFVYSGGGSAGTIINKDNLPKETLNEIVVTLAEAFEAEGFEVNGELKNFYESFSDYNSNRERGIATLYQPSIYSYPRKLLVNAVKFSDVGVVVISRNASESVDIPLSQSKNDGKPVTDNTRTYLQLTTEEELLIDFVCDNFDKVIVLLNTGNPMETGFLEDVEIDAAMYVGFTGQSGTFAIPRLLKGYKTVVDEDGKEKRIPVTPSGRLSDTYAYSTRDYNPTDANMWAMPHKYTAHGQITYTEGIYFGYRWYETANAEGFFDEVENEYGKGYDGVVQYPFGYGLSYGTDFSYRVETSLPPSSEIAADTEITVKVTVINSENAKAAGKEVVQLYFTPQYYKGEIEKAEVNLLAFAKTQTLYPGTSQQLNFKITPYELACYDAYGLNPGVHTGYELDRGSYTISLRSDAHTLIECENNELVYNVSQTVNFDEDPVTGERVENRFTGAEAYMGMPIDGSAAGGPPVEYLTRAEFFATYPYERTPDRTDTAKINYVNTLMNDRYDTSEQTVTGESNGLFFVVREDGSQASLAELQGEAGAKLRYNDELVLKLGSDYGDEQWEQLLNQLSVSDLEKLISNGYYGTVALESVGKPRRLDTDGPAGFHYNPAKDEIKSKWTAFPSPALTGCSFNQYTAFVFGQMQGVIANSTGVSGWYSPGLNLHRNPYSGRQFEYFGEDPVLIGKMAAEVVRGATNNGLYCYMKHFAVSEEGVNPDNVKTWLTEQTLREIYLKPFEIAVKEGGANAIMTAFNCIGAVWSSACDPLNNDILRGEWGFRGSLVSDWAYGDRDWMSGMRALRGGNDFLFDLNEPFDKTTTTVRLARGAAKNILYTFANTYAKAVEWQNTGDLDDRYKVELKIEVSQAPFSVVPVMMIVGVWALTTAGCGACLYFILKRG